MCEQTQVAYADGDIVWVKLGNLWWPGEVCTGERLPEGLLESMRKRPIAVVKFFQENTFEYVKHINDIYKYHCSRKHEFIKKGLDLYRSNNTYVEKFPSDVCTAERRTGGNPNIIRSSEFAPEEKPNISNIFGSGKRGAKMTRELPITSRVASVVPRAISNPRFANKPKHISRILSQSPIKPATASSATSEAKYNCSHCDFNTNRLNLIVLHNKIHKNNKEETSKGKKKNPPPKKPTVMKIYPSAAIFQQNQFANTCDSSFDSDDDTTTTTDSAASTSKDSIEKSIKDTDKRRYLNTKLSQKLPEKKQKTEIKTTLLADWSDNDSEDSCNIASLSITKKDYIIAKASSPPLKASSPIKPKYRNIPKKDRREFILDKFYTQVPSTSTDVHNVIVIDTDDSDGENNKKYVKIDDHLSDSYIQHKTNVLAIENTNTDEELKLDETGTTTEANEFSLRNNDSTVINDNIIDNKLSSEKSVMDSQYDNATKVTDDHSSKTTDQNKAETNIVTKIDEINVTEGTNVHISNDNINTNNTQTIADQIILDFETEPNICDEVKSTKDIATKHTRKKLSTSAESDIELFKKTSTDISSSNKNVEKQIKNSNRKEIIQNKEDIVTVNEYSEINSTINDTICSSLNDSISPVIIKDTNEKCNKPVSLEEKITEFVEKVEIKEEPDLEDVTNPQDNLNEDIRKTLDTPLKEENIIDSEPIGGISHVSITPLNIANEVHAISDLAKNSDNTQEPCKIEEMAQDNLIAANKLEQKEQTHKTVSLNATEITEELANSEKYSIPLNEIIPETVESKEINDLQKSSAEKTENQVQADESINLKEVSEILEKYEHSIDPESDTAVAVSMGTNLLIEPNIDVVSNLVLKDQLSVILKVETKNDIAEVNEKCGNSLIHHKIDSELPKINEAIHLFAEKNLTNSDENKYTDNAQTETLLDTDTHTNTIMSNKNEINDNKKNDVITTNALEETDQEVQENIILRIKRSSLIESSDKPKKSKHRTKKSSACVTDKNVIHEGKIEVNKFDINEEIRNNENVLELFQNEFEKYSKTEADKSDQYYENFSVDENTSISKRSRRDQKRRKSYSNDQPTEDDKKQSPTSSIELSDKDNKESILRNRLRRKTAYKFEDSMRPRRSSRRRRTASPSSPSIEEIEEIVKEIDEKCAAVDRRKSLTMSDCIENGIKLAAVDEIPTIDCSSTKADLQEDQMKSDQFLNFPERKTSTTSSSSPEKSDTAKDIDCFDFTEEEDEEIPKTLNRRKRRCLPPGKVFELETIDKIEAQRKVEEEEAKRLAKETEERDLKLSTQIDDLLTNTALSSLPELPAANKPLSNFPERRAEKYPEKTAKDDEVKDRSLPPKERNKRIFKSRNRNRSSEIDLESKQNTGLETTGESRSSIESSSIVHNEEKIRLEPDDTVIPKSPEICIKTVDLKPSPLQVVLREAIKNDAKRLRKIKSREIENKLNTSDSETITKSSPTELDLQVAEALINLPLTPPTLRHTEIIPPTITSTCDDENQEQIGELDREPNLPMDELKTNQIKELFESDTQIFSTISTNETVSAVTSNEIDTTVAPYEIISAATTNELVSAVMANEIVSTKETTYESVSTVTPNEIVSAATTNEVLSTTTASEIVSTVTPTEIISTSDSTGLILHGPRKRHLQTFEAEMNKSNDDVGTIALDLSKERNEMEVPNKILKLNDKLVEQLKENVSEEPINSMQIVAVVSEMEPETSFIKLNENQESAVSVSIPLNIPLAALEQSCKKFRRKSIKLSMENTSSAANSSITSNPNEFVSDTFSTHSLILNQNIPAVANEGYGKKNMSLTILTTTDTDEHLNNTRCLTTPYSVSTTQISPVNSNVDMPSVKSCRVLLEKDLLNRKIKDGVDTINTSKIETITTKVSVKTVVPMPTMSPKQIIVSKHKEETSNCIARLPKKRKSTLEMDDEIPAFIIKKPSKSESRETSPNLHTKTNTVKDTSYILITTPTNKLDNQQVGCSPKFKTVLDISKMPLVYNEPLTSDSLEKMPFVLTESKDINILPVEHNISPVKEQSISIIKINTTTASNSSPVTNNLTTHKKIKKIIVHKTVFKPIEQQAIVSLNQNTTSTVTATPTTISKIAHTIAHISNQPKITINKPNVISCTTSIIVASTNSVTESNQTTPVKSTNKRKRNNRIPTKTDLCNQKQIGIDGQGNPVYARCRPTPSSTVQSQPRPSTSAVYNSISIEAIPGTSSLVIPKGRIVQAGNGQIVITSKGALITTSTQTQTTSRMCSIVSPQSAISTTSMIVSSTQEQQSNKTILSPSRIQVQSQSIIRSATPTSQITSNTQQSQPQSVTSATTPVVVQPIAQPASNNTVVASRTVIPSQRTPNETARIRSIVASTPTGSVRRDVIKMSPQKLAEMERLGYIEEKPDGKVLTLSGYRKIQKQEKTITKKTFVKRISRTVTSTIVVNQESQQTTTAQIPQIPPLAPISELSPTKLSQKIKQTKSSILPALQTNTLVQSSTVMQDQLDSLQQLCETQSEISVADQQTPVQDLLAVPGDVFGGPPNCYFLCSLDENGTFIPMFHQPLYMDSSNQLIPTLPDGGSGTDVDAVQTLENMMNAHLVQQQQQLLEYNNVDAVISSEPDISPLQDSSNSTYLINTNDGQQIILDQQGLLALAAGGDIQQFMTTDGQQIILPSDLLSAITLNEEVGLIGGQQIIIPEELAIIQGQTTNQDIIAAALAGTEAFAPEQFISDVLIESPNAVGEITDPAIAYHALQQSPGTALTNATNAVLTQPPIMSTLEQPTKTDRLSPNVSIDLIGQNIDASLAVIGVTSHTNIPTSLELPITITNPEIAPKTTTNPLSLSAIYPSSVGSVIGLTSSSQITSVPAVSEHDLNYDLFSTALPITHHQLTQSLSMATAHHNHRHRQLNNNGNSSPDDVASMDMDSNSDIVPVTPESVTNHRRSPAMTGFTSDNSNSSSEIPLQPNLILRPDEYEHHHNNHYISNNEGTTDDDTNPGFSDARQYIDEQTLGEQDTFNDDSFSNR